MIANEGSTSTKGGAPRILNGPNFNYSTWEIHVGAYLMRFPGVREALAVEIPAQETGLAKQERIDAYKSASDKAYYILIEACTDSSIGQIVMVAHFAADPELWANNLSKMLRLRFTLQATKRVVNLK